LPHCAQEDASRDIDLLAAFDEHRKLSILDVIHIGNQADLLGHSVHLIEEGTLKPRVKGSVDAEARRAF
jgi:predicted nucleotidyltransferase